MVADFDNINGIKWYNKLRRLHHSSERFNLVLRSGPQAPTAHIGSRHRHWTYIQRQRINQFHQDYQPRERPGTNKTSYTSHKSSSSHRRIKFQHIPTVPLPAPEAQPRNVQRPLRPHRPGRHHRHSLAILSSNPFINETSLPLLVRRYPHERHVRTHRGRRGARSFDQRQRGEDCDIVSLPFNYYGDIS